MFCICHNYWTDWQLFCWYLWPWFLILSVLKFLEIVQRACDFMSIHMSSGSSSSESLGAKLCGSNLGAISLVGRIVWCEPGGLQIGEQVDGRTAQIFNDHYAAISTDTDYRAPRLKLTAPNDLNYITEMFVFRMLDTLRPTATGIDQIPAWFLRLGAPVFAASLVCLFHQSLTTSVVSRQWKTAVITPIPKIATPALPSAEGLPAYLDYASSVAITRAVRCSGIHIPDTTPAVRVARLQRSIRVQAIWFDDRCYRGDVTYRAFYAGRQRLRSRLLVPLFEGVWYGPTRVANQQTSTASSTRQHLQLGSGLFREPCHCNKYAGLVSAIAVIKASVIQGSAIGPRPMPSLRPTCIHSIIITGFLTLRMTPIWLCRASQRARAWARLNTSKHGRQTTT